MNWKAEGAAAQPRLPESPWKILMAAGAISAATLAAYLNAFSVPLHFDDNLSIGNNPTIRHLGSAFWPPIGTTVGGRPILNLSLAINYALSGTAVWSYHAANLAIHIIAGLTLFGIVRQTLAPRTGSSALPVAFSVALLWSLHPLQTESVTYLVQRAESLMGMFYLLTLYWFIRGAKAGGSGGRMWFVLCVAACFLGMGTKEVMVTAPLVVLLYDRTFIAGSFREAWNQRWRVYAGMAATLLVLPFLVFSMHGRGGTAGYGSGASWWGYALAQFPAIVHYLRLCFWPNPLVFDYGVAINADFPRALPYALVVIGLLAASAWALVKRPPLGFLCACFFVILAPSSSIVPVATETMAEHRMYLPLAPLVVLAVFEIYRWLGRAGLPVCLVIAAALFGATWQRNKVYSSDEGLWSDTVASVPGNERAQNNLGLVLSKVPGRLHDAITHYEAALESNPGYAIAHYNLGNALSEVPGRLPDAIAQYEAALKINPDDALAHNNLGNALSKVPGRLGEATAQYEAALKINPDDAEAQNNLGNALCRTPGRLPDAIVHYEAALRINPGYANAQNSLGIALADMPGRLPDAIAHFEAALKINPSDARTHNNLGIALSRIPGRIPEAISQFEAALEINPGNAEAHLNLGCALLAAGDRGEAAQAQFDSALRLRPDWATLVARLRSAQP
jgi:protein O-mannosyl-transferase